MKKYKFVLDSSYTIVHEDENSKKVYCTQDRYTQEEITYTFRDLT